MATMTPPSTCLFIILMTAALSTAMLFCSSPQGPLLDAALEDIPEVADTYVAPPDEGVWDAGNYEGCITGPPCSGPAGGCGNAWCFPNCGVPGQPGGPGAGGNTQQ